MNTSKVIASSPAAEALAKISVEVPQSLYSASEKIYPREIKGRFQRYRNASVVLLLGLYYGAPWLQWHDRQAILFDLPARKFHLFSLTLWPQDFVFLALLLIVAGLSLFFFTAVAGRVWCGFACPQTVWTEAFIWMERWVEGSRRQQMKLSEMPWNFTKLRKRISKQVLWISFALFTGLTFVGYFAPIRQLVIDFSNFEIAGWSLFWVLFYGFATYGNAGYMREQVCKYMCPYARFQSAMFDKDTLIVAYDAARGEPRARGKRYVIDAANPVGDCVDCGICVQVCPTGIDIREGLQYECIACAACVDACDDVMDKVGLRRGLIRYSSERRDQGEERSFVRGLMRPRVVLYAGLLGLVLVGFITALLLRANFQVDILRDRNAMYRWADQTTVENTYQIKVMNKTQFTQSYGISVEGLPGANTAWAKPQLSGLSREVKAGQMGDFTATVTVSAELLQHSPRTIKFSFLESQGAQPAQVVEESRFWGPAKR